MNKTKVAFIVITGIVIISGALFFFIEDEHVAEGRKLFIHFCDSCHGQKGRGDGFNSTHLDPLPRDLSDRKEVFMAKQNNEYLFKVIAQGGKAVEKSPRMPPFGFTLSENEIWKIIAFIRTLHSYKDEVIDFNGGFDQTRPKTSIKKIPPGTFQKLNRRKVMVGKNLFKKLGCSACHIIGNQGGKAGPPLTHIGSRLNGDWTYRFIKNPQRMIHNVRMPNFGLSDVSSLRITHYLLSLK